MREIVKHIIGVTYRPLLITYLSRTRTYNYKGITLKIPPQVFHPGFFSSTKILLQCIAKEHLNNKAFLELGAGSGLLSIYASKKGAAVIASDISPVAIQCIQANAWANGVDIKTIHSNLFDNIAHQKFDFILINPPYYKKKPLSVSDYAWYCGENGEYFQRLFQTMADYLNDDSNVFMVLCDGCDLQMIQRIAKEHLFQMKCVHTKKTLIEMNFVFKIRQVK